MRFEVGARRVSVLWLLCAGAAGAVGLGGCSESGPPSEVIGKGGTAGQGGAGGSGAGLSLGGSKAGTSGAAGTAGTASGGMGGSISGGNAGNGGGGGSEIPPGNTTMCAETVIDELTELAPGTLVDARDGRAYRTIQIGTQLWMAENLDYGLQVDAASGQVDDAVDEKLCVDDCTAACAVLGGLYTFAEAFGLPSNCNHEACQGFTKPMRGICPEGWHVPDIEEWDLLESTVEAEVGQFFGGNALRSTEGWLPDPDFGTSGNGTDAYGLRILPTGVYSSAFKDYYSLGETAYYWPTYNAPGGVSAVRYFTNGNRNIVHDTHTKTMGFSVRCVAD